MAIAILNFMNYWRGMVFSVFIIEIFKRWLLKYLFFEWTIPANNNEFFQVKSSSPYYLRDRTHLFNRSPIKWPKIWTMVPLELKKYQSLYSVNKKYKKIEIKLSKSVMQNLLATCWFCLINMCGINTFLFCYSYIM